MRFLKKMVSFELSASLSSISKFLCLCSDTSPESVHSSVNPSRFQSFTVLSAEVVANCLTSGLKRHFKIYFPADGSTGLEFAPNKLHAVTIHSLELKQTLPSWEERTLPWCAYSLCSGSKCVVKDAPRIIRQT